MCKKTLVYEKKTGKTKLTESSLMYGRQQFRSSDAAPCPNIRGYQLLSVCGWWFHARLFQTRITGDGGFFWTQVIIPVPINHINVPFAQKKIVFTGSIQKLEFGI
jgi:hypothetical protein